MTAQENRASAASFKGIGALTSVLIVSHSMSNITQQMIAELDNTLWQAMVIAALIGVAAAFALKRVLKSAPEGGDMFGALQSLMGGVAAKAMAAAILLVFLDTAIFCAQDAAMASTIDILPTTSPYLITALFALAALIAAIQGGPPLSAQARFAVFIMLGLYSLMLFLTRNMIHWNFLFPLGGNGFALTLKSGVAMSGYFADLLLVGLLTPVAGGARSMGRAAVRAAAASSVTLVVTMLAFNLCMWSRQTPIGVPPILELMSIADSGRYLQRLGSIMVFMWGTMQLMGIAGSLFAVSRCWAFIFGLPDWKPVCASFALIVVAIRLPLSAFKPEFVSKGAPLAVRAALLAIVVIPALVIALIRERRRPRAQTAAQ